jgi:hypothetical protein
MGGGCSSHQSIETEKNARIALKKDPKNKSKPELVLNTESLNTEEAERHCKHPKNEI